MLTESQPDHFATAIAGSVEPKPAELWLLRSTDRGCFVLSVDDARGGPTRLACFSEAEAIAAADHQRDLYDIDCVPVRVL